MKYIYLLISFILSSSINAKDIFDDFNEKFSAGNYQDAIIYLKQITISESNVGRAEFLKALAYARINEFDQAKNSFELALSNKYQSDEIYYEYGQTLYALDDYKQARIAFKKSVKSKYKVGVSLYYIAFISQELNDTKKAVSFYTLIEKLPESEKKDVIQAARMQVGDIYLSQIEKLPDSYSAIEKYVIPQYKKALEWDQKSSLAPDIRDKIEKLKRKYELELFRMRNGRPTARPPYFLKVNALYGVDSNVNLAQESSDELSSPYYSTGFFGRYTIYPNSSYSVSPELIFNMTKYLSDKEEVFLNNNYSTTASVKVNYEHLYNNRAATFFLGLSYTYGADDADTDKSFDKRDERTAVSFSEQLELWANNPSTFRYTYSKLEDVTVENNYNTHGLSYEQVILIGKSTLFIYSNYDMNKYLDEEDLNNNSFLFRADYIFGTVFGLFNPTVYSSINTTDYFNNSEKGETTSHVYGLNLNRPVGEKLYLTLDLSMTNQSGKLDTDKYKKQVMSLNLDYIY